MSLSLHLLPALMLALMPPPSSGYIAAPSGRVERNLERNPNLVPPGSDYTAAQS